jgi:hypothetical protein
MGPNPGDILPTVPRDISNSNSFKTLHWRHLDARHALDTADGIASKAPSYHYRVLFPPHFGRFGRRPCVYNPANGSPGHGGYPSFPHIQSSNSDRCIEKGSAFH